MKKLKKILILIICTLIIPLSGILSSCNNNQYVSKNNKDGSFTGTLVNNRINSTIDTVIINKCSGKNDDEHYFFETQTIESFNLYREDFTDQYNVYRIDFNFNDNIDKYIIKKLSFDISSPTNIELYFILNDTYSNDSIVSISKNLDAKKTQTITLEFDYDGYNTPQDKTKGLKLNFCSSPYLNQMNDALIPKNLSNFYFTYLPKEN